MAETQNTPGGSLYEKIVKQVDDLRKDDRFGINVQLGQQGLSQRHFDRRKAYLKLLYTNISTIQIINSIKPPDVIYSTSVRPGSLYLFQYWPKNAAKLAVWDEFPLILVTEVTSTYVLGINLHHLPENLRYYLLESYRFINEYDGVVFRQQIQKVMNTPKYRDVAMMALRKYLFNHLGSSFRLIRYDDWPDVIIAPLEKMHEK